jgi:hypothetical protein
MTSYSVSKFASINVKPTHSYYKIPEHPHLIIVGNDSIFNTVSKAIFKTEHLISLETFEKNTIGSGDGATTIGIRYGNKHIHGTIDKEHVKLIARCVNSDGRTEVVGKLEFNIRQVKNHTGTYTVPFNHYQINDMLFIWSMNTQHCNAVNPRYTDGAFGDIHVINLESLEHIKIIQNSSLISLRTKDFYMTINSSELTILDKDFELCGTIPFNVQPNTPNQTGMFSGFDIIDRIVFVSWFRLQPQVGSQFDRCDVYKILEAGEISPEDQCCVCHKKRDENIVPYPCGDASYCKKCLEAIKKESAKCAICGVQVKDILAIKK